MLYQLSYISDGRYFNKQLATQTGANSDELQTSLAKGAQGLQQGFDYKDTNWQQYGADAQLALASLLKYESPDVFEDVSFTS